MSGRYETYGILKYSPKLLDKGYVSENWWAILDLDPDDQIGKYFRHLYWLATYKTSKIIRPVWKEHVTIVRNEEPPNKEFWEKWPGQKLPITVILTPETNGYYYWLPVCCEAAYVLRQDLGLTIEPIIPFHLSIGHIANAIDNNT